jgi:hypothetical protein
MDPTSEYEGGEKKDNIPTMSDSALIIRSKNIIMHF